MKTQHRNFVVERKSGRRRLTVQPGSIWGNTDLKALVREAEADAPHLFEPNAVSATSGQESERQPEPASETLLHDQTDPEQQKQIVPSAVAAEQASPSEQGDDLTLNAPAQLKLDTPGPRSPRMATRRPVAAHSRRAEGGNTALTLRPTAVKVEVPDDELFALEQENCRLKSLLAQHYRQQNMQLRTMLVRFGVN